MDVISPPYLVHSRSSRVEQGSAVEGGPTPASVLAWTSTPYLVEGLRLLRMMLSTSRVAPALRRCHIPSCSPYSLYLMV